MTTDELILQTLHNSTLTEELRDAEIEALARIDTLAVDKTGTLTEGRPSLTDLVTMDSHDERGVLRLAASLEAVSEHPLARAIVDAADERGIDLDPVDDFRALTGQGVRGRVDGHDVVLGNAALMKSIGVDFDDSNEQIDKLRGAAKTVMLLAVDAKPAGLVAVRDRIKPGVRDLLESLREDGLRVVMLTGDNEATAKAVAGELGLGEYAASQTPQDKAEWIQHARKGGAKVAMAGDGINDAPALAAADVGIAMGTGADVAMQSAGVTLIKGDLNGIARDLRHIVAADKP